MEEAQETQATADRPRRLEELVELMLEMLDVTEGEVTPELEALFATVEAKVEGYAHVHMRLEAEAEATKKLASYYNDRAKVKQGNADRLKERLHEQLTKAGRPRIETPTVTVSVQKSPARLVLRCTEAEVPDQYKMEPPKVIVKATLIDAVKNGTIETIPDPKDPTRQIAIATLEQSTHVRIR